MDLIIVFHRRKEDLIMEKIKIVGGELIASMKNDEAELREDFLKEVKSIERNLKVEVAKVLGEVKNVQKSLKAEILKVKTPAAEFIPECPICLHQMAPPTKIVHCVHGHKLCETCSKKEAVKSCPTCKTGFMGRDFGMEAYIRTISGED